MIIPTLTYQLEKYSATFAISLQDSLNKDPDLAIRKPNKQIEELLIKPWNAVMNTGEMGAHMPVVVIDALDECDNASMFLKPLKSVIQTLQLYGLKFFTSRPEQVIQQLVPPGSLYGGTVSEIQRFVLHRMEESLVQQDNCTYAKSELAEISPSEERLQSLKSLAGTLFIYAPTVVRFLKGVSGHTRQKNRSRDSIKQGHSPEDMKSLYAAIMNDAIPMQKSVIQGNCRRLNDHLWNHLCKKVGNM